MSANTSTNENIAKTIQYIIHFTCTDHQWQIISICIHSTVLNLASVKAHLSQWDDWTACTYNIGLLKHQISCNEIYWQLHPYENRNMMPSCEVKHRRLNGLRLIKWSSSITGNKQLTIRRLKLHTAQIFSIWTLWLKITRNSNICSHINTVKWVCKYYGKTFKAFDLMGALHIKIITDYN